MFAPAAPLGGYLGFRLLDRTGERQRVAFEKAPDIQRDIAYFRTRIREVESAAAFVADRRLLQVALGAFGLDTEISKRAIIRRVLEEAPDRAESFAARLNDPRWRAFARTFNFSATPPRLPAAAFDQSVTTRYVELSFERALGEDHPDIRLALNFRREIASIAAGAGVDRSGWFQVLSQPPLRRVVEAAFGLPASLAQLDVDRQRQILEAKAQALFGASSPAAFRDPKNVDTAIRRFFAVESLQGDNSGARGSAALSILTAAPFASLVRARASF